MRSKRAFQISVGVPEGCELAEDDVCVTVTGFDWLNGVQAIPKMRKILKLKSKIWCLMSSIL